MNLVHEDVESTPLMRSTLLQLDEELRFDTFGSTLVGVGGPPVITSNISLAQIEGFIQSKLLNKLLETYVSAFKFELHLEISNVLLIA